MIAITREDIRREIARLRSAVERDPEVYGSLSMLLEDPPADDYDPQRLSVPKAPAPGLKPEPVAVELAAQKAPRATKLLSLQARRALFMEYMEHENELLKEGKIDVAQWLQDMQEQLKGLHISAYAIGRAGQWNEMTYRDWGRVGQLLRTQYDYARRWAGELSAGVQGVSLAQLNARARLYANAAQQTFEQGLVSELGIDPSVLPAWPAKGTLCKANCKCRWAIRILSKARGDFDVSWRLGIAEHCSTCRRRAKAYKRLRIRGGHLIDPVEPIND